MAGVFIWGVTPSSLSGAMELTRLILPALSSVLSHLQIIEWTNGIFGMPSDTLKPSAVHPLTTKGIRVPSRASDRIGQKMISPESTGKREDLRVR